MYSPQMDLPVLAGIVSTMIFTSSTLPMLVKALRTRDLASYSLGNLALANVGNAVHSVYVFSLPPGPLWALHSFHLVTTTFMLVWYLRFGLVQRRGTGPRAAMNSSTKRSYNDSSSPVPTARGTDLLRLAQVHHDPLRGVPVRRAIGHPGDLSRGLKHIPSESTEKSLGGQ